MITKRVFIVVSFLLFGVIIGFATIPYDRQHDTALYLNLPGIGLSEVLQGGWVRFVSDNIPWILRFPQLYVLASVLCWGIIGALFAAFLKPRIIAWIVGIYLVIFGILTILVEFF